MFGGSIFNKKNKDNGNDAYKKWKESVVKTMERYVKTITKLMADVLEAKSKYGVRSQKVKELYEKLCNEYKEFSTFFSDLYSHSNYKNLVELESEVKKGDETAQKYNKLVELRPDISSFITELKEQINSEKKKK